MIKKILFFVFIIASLFVINDLVHSIYSLWQKNDLIVRSRDELAREKNKNSELKMGLKKVGENEFVEEEARNKLFLARPGEGIVVVAPTMYISTNSAERSAVVIDGRSNWEKWWDLFFKDFDLRS